MTVWAIVDVAEQYAIFGIKFVQNGVKSIQIKEQRKKKLKIIVSFFLYIYIYMYININDIN